MEKKTIREISFDHYVVNLCNVVKLYERVNTVMPLMVCDTAVSLNSCHCQSNYFFLR